MSEDAPNLRVVIAGVELTLRPDTPDLPVARRCLKKGEFDLVKGFLPRLKRGLIVDAGGYIGTAAIAFSKLYPEATVVTIEPSSRNFAVLQQNVAAFPNIIALNKALVGTARKVDLGDRGTGEWGFTIIEKPLDRRATHIEQVDGITIDDVIEMTGKEGADIVKLDIEGGEVDVLNHSKKWLPNTTVLIAELHERIAAGCEEAFRMASEGRYVVKKGEKSCAVLKEAMPPDFLAEDRNAPAD